MKALRLKILDFYVEALKLINNNLINFKVELQHENK